MGPYITDAQLKEAVAAALGTTAADLAADQWDPIIAGANFSAANDIVQALTLLGHSVTNIDAWDQAADFNRDLGTFWALARGAGLGAYNAPQLKALDRRDELRKMTALIIGGVPVAPTPNETTVGGITHGQTGIAARLNAEFDVLSGRCGCRRW